MGNHLLELLGQPSGIVHTKIGNILELLELLGQILTSGYPRRYNYNARFVVPE